MRLSKSRSGGPLGFNMTPMIDIVFLLIIFFMTVSQITRNVEAPLPLPRVKQGDSAARTASISIAIDQTGAMAFAGRSLPLSQVMSRVSRTLAEVDGNPDRLRVKIRVHRECPSRFVTELLVRLSEQGVTRVRSAVSDQ